MQIAILPNATQEKELFEKALQDLNVLFEKKQGWNKNLRTLLQTSLNQLSNKDMLTSQELYTHSYPELIDLLENELAEDFDRTPTVQRLLNLLASKTPKKIKTVKNIDVKNTGESTGIPEKLGRFSRYIPK